MHLFVNSIRTKRENKLCTFGNNQKIQCCALNKTAASINNTKSQNSAKATRIRRNNNTKLEVIGILAAT